MTERSIHANVYRGYFLPDMLEFIFQKLYSLKDVKNSNCRFGERGNWLFERWQEKSPTEEYIGGASKRHLSNREYQDTCYHTLKKEYGS